MYAIMLDFSLFCWLKLSTQSLSTTAIMESRREMALSPSPGELGIVMVEGQVFFLKCNIIITTNKQTNKNIILVIAVRKTCTESSCSTRAAAEKKACV